jgi:hypothetical protein
VNPDPGRKGWGRGKKQNACKCTMPFAIPAQFLNRFQREASAAESITVMVRHRSKAEIDPSHQNWRVHLAAPPSVQREPSGRASRAITHYVSERPGTARLSAQDLEALTLGSCWAGRQEGDMSARRFDE